MHLNYPLSDAAPEAFLAKLAEHPPQLVLCPAIYNLQGAVRRRRPHAHIQGAVPQKAKTPVWIVNLQGN